MAAASAASAAANATSAGQRPSEPSRARRCATDPSAIITSSHSKRKHTDILLKRASAWIEGFAMGLGAPGLFLLAFVDSSFLALPEVVDILIIWMVIEHPDRWLLYGSMATAGSLA